MVLRNFDELIQKVTRLPRRMRCGVVAADELAITGALEAEQYGLAAPVFLGDEALIRACLESAPASQSYEILNIPDPAAAAVEAVRLVREKQLDFLLKGHIETSVLMKAVVDKEKGLATDRLMTHLVLNQLPTYHKLLATSDGGMVLYPDVEKKQQILENAVAVLRKLGYEQPKVAVLAAVEHVNPKMRETLDAAELKRRWEAGQIPYCIVEGPISFDLAYSKAAAAIKGYDSPVAGDADVMIASDIVVGNVLGKSLLYAAGGKMAGFIVGAQCPIILTSRASSPEERFYSIALAALVGRDA